MSSATRALQAWHGLGLQAGWRVLGAALSICLVLACSDDAERKAAEPSASEAADPSSRPNVILYVVDTLRADALPLYGHAEVETPGLDGLARDGAVYTRARSASSWTRASVATLLTGLRPEAHGIETRADIAGGSLDLLSEVFARHGYRVGAVIANPNLGSTFGFDQGWDDFIELYEHSGGFVRSSDATATADDVVEKAIEWLGARDERPFFLFVLPIDPHSPYQPPIAYDRYGPRYGGSVDGSLPSLTRSNLKPEDKRRLRALYDGEVAYHDSAFSRLLWHLEGEKLVDDTIVVFTSDHGEEFWEHGKRSHGLALYEESVHVPLVIRAPGDLALAHHVDRDVEGVDVFPTVLDLAGIPRPGALDGRSLAVDELETRPSYMSLRLDDTDQRAVVAGSWKLVIDDRSDEARLFDLASDPGERSDLYERHAETAAALRRVADEISGDATRRNEAFAHDAGSIADDELSPALRAALEALGYIEPEPEPAGTNR